MRIAAVVVQAALLGACSEARPPASDPVVPDDFPDLPTPDDNALTPERIALGKTLFFDRRLSRTGEISCASCHQQEHAFADPHRFSTGIEGRQGSRNAPALVNLAWNTSFFWHGGAPTLELQVVGPIQNPVEMDMTLTEVAGRLTDDGQVVAAFRTAYGVGPSEYSIPRALASFVRSLVSGDSRYDHYRRGDRSALAADEVRGMDIFMGERGECFHCHVGFNFTSNDFANDGIAPDDPDLGRAEVTLREIDIGKFKIPTLRNVAVTAPYMHDGSLATLADVIGQYDRGGRGHPNTDATIRPLGLDAAERSDLEAFLKALTDDAFLRNPHHRPR